MSTASFERALAFTLAQEGGFVDDADDPGGMTNFGITQRDYPNEDIRHLTRERAAEIYHRDYWTPTGCDAWPEPVAIVVFDSAVNCGVGRTVRWLQQAAGAKADGIIGPQTRAAVAAADPLTLANRILWLRLRRYFDISSGTLLKFLRGWLLRCVQLHETIDQLPLSPGGSRAGR